MLINGADFNIKSQKNGKLAKYCTDNQRIIFLIEKHEKFRALEMEEKSSIDISSEEEEDD